MCQAPGIFHSTLKVPKWLSHFSKFPQWNAINIGCIISKRKGILDVFHFSVLSGACSARLLCIFAVHVTRLPITKFTWRNTIHIVYMKHAWAYHLVCTFHEACWCLQGIHDTNSSYWCNWDHIKCNKAICTLRCIPVSVTHWRGRWRIALLVSGEAAALLPIVFEIYKDNILLENTIEYLHNEIQVVKNASIDMSLLVAPDSDDVYHTYVRRDDVRI